MIQTVTQAMKLSGVLPLCLFVGACNQQNAERPPTPDQMPSERCETAIRSVIDLEFTAPDEELMGIEKEISNQMQEDLGEDIVHPGYVEGNPQLDEFYAYAATTYEPYFSESGIEKFAHSEDPAVFSFHRSNLDYRLVPTLFTLQEIELEDNILEFNSFEFNVIEEYQAGSDDPT